MFDFLMQTPLDDVVVAVNYVIRSIEYREDITGNSESETGVNGTPLSHTERAVAQSIANEIRQSENLPISYLTNEAATEYTLRLAEIVQKNIREDLSNQEIHRGREILRRWQQDAPGAIVGDSPADAMPLTYFLVGAGIGAALGLLFAPKSGEEMRNDIADATRKGIEQSKEAAQQLGVRAREDYDNTRAKAGEYYETARETAGEYVEATREKATELYDTATTKAGEVAAMTRDAAARQAGSISAAIEAGKKAYVEEKRKTELSGRPEAAPTYKPEKAM